MLIIGLTSFCYLQAALNIAFCLVSKKNKRRLQAVPQTYQLWHHLLLGGKDLSATEPGYNCGLDLILWGVVAHW